MLGELPETFAIKNEVYNIDRSFQSPRSNYSQSLDISFTAGFLKKFSFGCI